MAMIRQVRERDFLIDLKAHPFTDVVKRQPFLLDYSKTLSILVPLSWDTNVETTSTNQ